MFLFTIISLTLFVPNELEKPHLIMVFIFNDVTDLQ